MKQAKPAAKTTRSHEVLLIAAAVASGAILTLVLIVSKGGRPPSLSAAAADPSSAPRAAAAPAPDATTAVHTWTTEHKAFWLENRRGAAFELLAENKVSTWFGPTQPVLVVRCAARTIETFVYTRSATRIEPDVQGKTVTVSIDDEPAKTERWSDSDDRVALFAPDGAAFVQRLLHANTLRFGYSPHNSADVIAQFHVAGLKTVLEPVGRECGWKKEEGRGVDVPASRRAGVKD